MSAAELTAYHLGQDLAEGHPDASWAFLVATSESQFLAEDDVVAARRALAGPTWRYWVARGIYEHQAGHRPGG